VFARPPACDRTDPTLGITLHDGRVDARLVLLTAQASGGVSAATLLERP
jgi:hypothetical protein